MSAEHDLQQIEQALNHGAFSTHAQADQVLGDALAALSRVAAELHLQREAAKTPWSFHRGSLRERLEWCRVQHQLAADNPQEPLPEEQRSDFDRACTEWYREMVVQYDDLLSRVGERIDAQQQEISRLESLVAKSAENADVRADAGLWSGTHPRIVTLRRERDEAVAALREAQQCPSCFGKGLENQDDRPGIWLGPLGENECRVCGGTGRRV